MEKIKCEICGKEVAKNLGAHINHSHPEISQEWYYRKYLMKDLDEGTCPVCGKPTVFLGLTKGYRLHCSTKCSSLDKKVQEKLKKTTLDRYGVTNIFLLPEVQQKAHIATSTPGALEKRKQTNLKNLGVEFPAQSKDVQEKLKITSQTLYGTDYPSQAKIVREKIEQACLDKYGVKCNWASKNPKLNGRQYFLDNYGVSNPMQLRETHVKAAITRHNSKAADGTPLDSSWEVIVWNFCLEHNILIERNIPIDYVWQNSIHTTFIDFKINNKLYEVKGNHILEGYYDHISCPIDIKLEIYRNNNVSIICKNINKYINDIKYRQIKFVDLNKLEDLLDE